MVSATLIIKNVYHPRTLLLGAATLKVIKVTNLSLLLYRAHSGQAQAFRNDIIFCFFVLIIGYLFKWQFRLPLYGFISRRKM